MPRIIFKCRYLKNALDHLSNFVEYMATRARSGADNQKRRIALMELDKEYERIEVIYERVLKMRRVITDLQDIDQEINKVKASEHIISEQLIAQRQELEWLQPCIYKIKIEL